MPRNFEVGLDQTLIRDLNLELEQGTMGSLSEEEVEEEVEEEEGKNQMDLREEEIRMLGKLEKLTTYILRLIRGKIGVLRVMSWVRVGRLKG